MVKCIVQLDNFRFDDKKNIEKHLKLCRKAAKLGAKLIIFPELSITGYERAELKSHYVKNDPRLEEIRRFCIDRHVRVIVGAPIRENGHLYIGSIIFNPSGHDIIYKKMNLHEGENVYYEEGSEPILLTIDDELFFLGICYDIEVENHIEMAKKMGATSYVSSIFYSENGMKELPKKIMVYGRQYEMDFLVSNYHGPVWDTKAGGSSLYYHWNKDQLIMCPEAGDCLLMIDKNVEVIYE